MSTEAGIAAEKIRDQLKKPGRWVVKIGSALLTNDGLGLDTVAIADWVEQLAALKQRGYDIVLVSSGSVAEGLVRLGWNKRPTELSQLQAAAAVGQMGLVQAYEQEFQKYDLNTAQILLTHDDLSNRTRYLNARSTIKTLLEVGAIPVINENDTVVTDEIRFGDNDTLAGLVANLIQADTLVILTDQKGLYAEDPRKNPEAEFVSSANADDETVRAMASPSGGGLGRGGMQTKLNAARLATRSGANTLICSGRARKVLIRLAEGENIGTLLYAETAPFNARKQWLAGHLRVCGELGLDDGATRVLKQAGRSLLPVGVTRIKGRFKRGELVSIQDQAGTEIGRGLVNYSSEDALKIIGKSSEQILDILGFTDGDELIHRDNLILV
jgi:glutamate 5-kinase